MPEPCVEGGANQSTSRRQNGWPSDPAKGSYTSVIEMIRSARLTDVPAIQAIVNSHAERGKMLFKNFAQLYEALRDFAVYEVEGRVVGCVAVTIIWADLAEVR